VQRRRVRPHPPEYWDGVAWGLRMVLIGVHLCFAVPCLLRPNIPLILPSFKAFDDGVPFWTWAASSILAALLLARIPPRVPWGLVSTSFSAFIFFVIGALFTEGGGLIPGATLYPFCGALSGLLASRALWLWAVRVVWFQRYVMRVPRGG
jgi:hypothetical protein